MHAGSPPRKTVEPETTPVLPLLALLGANAALAFGPWFVRLADTGPVASAFWRISLAAPFLLGASLATGWRPNRDQGREQGNDRGSGFSLGFWGMLALGGLCFAGDLASWHIGILRTTLANATLFGNSTTFIFPVYGFLIARAWPTRLQAMALALATCGAALLMGQSYHLDPRHLVGDLLCVLAGVLYTGYLIVMVRARSIMAPLPALALSTVASVLPLLCFAVMLGERLVPTDWTPLIGLALVSQIVGQGMMIYALGRLSPLTVGLGLLTQPVVAATIGWVVYNERLGLTDLIGALCVAVALVLVSRRARA